MSKLQAFFVSNSHFFALALVLAACGSTQTAAPVEPASDSIGADNVPPPSRSLSSLADFEQARRWVDTAYGRIALVENGAGPVAVFLHGFPLNGFHFRHQLTHLADLRRCIAIDLMGLGHTEVAADQDLRFGTQADMVLATLDALGVQEFDLVGNDSGGGVAQLIVAKASSRVRSLALTNSDVHDNWPPKALDTVHSAAKQEVLDDILASYVEDLEATRNGLGALVYEDPAYITEETTRAYLAPITADERRRGQVNRFVALQDHAETVAIEGALRAYQGPTLVVWGTGDVFFDVSWAHWLRGTIPGVTQVIELEGAKLFFPEERHAVFSQHLRAHWTQ